MNGLVAIVLATTWSLSVERTAAATTCPDEPRLRRAIAERLGRDPFTSPTKPLDASVRPTRLDHRSASASDSKDPYASASDFNDPYASASDSNDPYASASDSNDPYASASDSNDPYASASDSASDASLKAPSAQPGKLRGDARRGGQSRPVGAARGLVVSFSRDGSRHLAAVSILAGPGQRAGTRTLSSTGADCAELTEVIVLGATIVIDPLASSKRAAPPAQRPGVHTRMATAQLALEQASVQQARVAMTGRDTKGALEALAVHRDRFPTGQLTEERMALEVMALVSGGRGHEAKSAATAFRRRFPNGLFRGAVDAVSPE